MGRLGLAVSLRASAQACPCLLSATPCRGPCIQPHIVASVTVSASPTVPDASPLARLCARASPQVVAGDIVVYLLSSPQADYWCLPIPLTSPLVWPCVAP